MSALEELLWGLGYCLFMLLLIRLLSRNTPKQINTFYGYRTPRSMRTPKTWEAANAYANKLMWRFSLYSLALPLIGWFLWKDHNFLVTVIGHTLLVISVIYFTERYLGRHFDSNGQPRADT
jgi:uncharacterized membrane protein